MLKYIHVVTLLCQWILCFADRASWYNSGKMTNLMHSYVI